MIKSITKVFSSALFAKFILGVVGILLIRFMNAPEFAALTFAVGLATAISQVIASSINKIYIIGYDKLNLRENSFAPLSFQALLISIAVLLLLPFSAKLGNTFIPIISLIIGNCFSRFVQTYFQLKRSFGSYAMIEITRAVLILLGFLILLYWNQYNICAWQVIILQAGVRFFVFVVFMFMNMGLQNIFNLRSGMVIMRVVLVSNYKYLIGYFSIFAIFAQVDVFCLRILSDNYNLASYGAAFRYYSLLILALGSVKTVLFPVIKTAKTKTDVEDIYSQYWQLVKYILPLVFLGTLLAGWIMPLVDAGKYPSSITVFRILSISAAISFCLSPYSELLHSNEKFSFMFYLMFISLILNIGLNIILIVWFGDIGAAIGTTVAFAIANIIIFRKSRSVIAAYRRE